jgi:putative hemolysin
MQDKVTLQSPVEELLQKKNLLVEADRRDLKNLSGKAPFIAIANSALDDMDELALIHLLSQSGTPFKVLTNEMVKPPALRDFFLTVKINLLQIDDYVKDVFRELKKAKEQGVSICILLHFTDRSLDTPVRQEYLNRLMRAMLKVELPIIPIRLKAPFPDFVRPIFGKRLIFKDRKEPYPLTVRIGSAITIEEQAKIGKPKDFRRFLQSKIFSLGSGLEVKPFFLSSFFKPAEHQEPLIEPVDPQLIANEIAQLPADRLIAAQSEYDIFVVEAKDIPQTLREIGRLRELTFREVGEGTGKSLDLDEYDLYYRQLILWDRDAQQVAGGYRMGLGDEIFRRYGASGFYISAMFKIKEGFHPTMQQSVELGRSYIVPAYQKKRLPLFLLWKGILFFLLKNQHYRYLYGPVSISKYYSNISRSVIVAFIKKHYFNHDLAQYLKPRKPFKAKVDKVDVEFLADSLGNELQSLDNLVEDIEPAHFRIPVLVRQYLKLNARFISFNLDPNFSDVLDGFIILDLKDVPFEMIEALKKEA